jgi:hypothetical protein
MNLSFLERGLAVFFSAGAVCLLALTAFWHFAPTPDPALEVAEVDMEVLDGYAGQKRDIVFRLDNRSGRALPVHGVAGC